jgi:hypothetical protein
VDDVNEVCSFDQMLLTKDERKDPREATFYKMLKGIGQCVFNTRIGGYFTTPLVMGTTQSYIDAAFEASDFSPLRSRLSLLSNEDSKEIVSHYEPTGKWKKKSSLCCLCRSRPGLSHHEVH